MKNRLTETEKLDDLSLNGQPLHQALQSLAWINRWFGNHRAVIKNIKKIAAKQNKPLRIVDLGCGGGDLVLAIARSCRQQMIDCHITGIDGNANSLLYAQKRAGGFGHIDFLQADILHENFQIPHCDILLSSHFMYHFSDDQLSAFLRKNLSFVTTAAIFSELNRSSLAALLFRCSSFLLPVSKLAREDGLLAIKRSINKKEWINILQEARISRYHLQTVPLFRLLLIIEKGNS